MMHKDKSCKKKCLNCGDAFFRDKRNTWAYWAAAKFCGSKCSSVYNAMQKEKDTPTLADAFWRKVEKGKDRDCWSWSGVKDKDGYPLVTFRKKLLRANRVALIIYGVSIPDGHHACHSCGNKECCNPSHIYCGSPKQNAKDKIKHKTHKQGADVYCAKLTALDVLAIRSSSDPARKLAQAYGVSPSNISAIRTRKTWRHVN